MMAKSLMIFTLIMLMLAACVVWFIEHSTETDIVARNVIQRQDSHQLKVYYYRAKIKSRAWWSRVKGKIKQITGSEAESASEPTIIRWQDHNGVWHFEEKKSAPPQ